MGNVLIGIAIWRSGTLPRWAGALWSAAPVLMYPLGLVYAVTLGSNSTPPTVVVGALLIVVSGGWMAWSVLRGLSTMSVSAGARPRVQ